MSYQPYRYTEEQAGPWLVSRSSRPQVLGDFYISRVIRVTGLKRFPTESDACAAIAEASA